MKAFFDYSIYPQVVWAKEINQILNSSLLKNSNNYTIVDAPCGNGVITYWVKKKQKNRKFLLYDIDERLLDIVNKNLKGVSWYNADIFKLNLETSENIWLFINSLYCLPEGEKLIETMSKQMKYVIAVFPYIGHPNYKAFLAANPDFKNPSAMTEPETLALFEKYGYKTILKKGCTFISYHKIRPTILLKASKRLLAPIERLWGKNSPAYWLAVFEKQV
ncbi:MAG: methyltransferase [Bacteroidales bacterium]|nr:methyltransferase [Bacteroidales bacterium]